MGIVKLEIMTDRPIDRRRQTDMTHTEVLERKTSAVNSVLKGNYDKNYMTSRQTNRPTDIRTDQTPISKKLLIYEIA